MADAITDSGIADASPQQLALDMLQADPHGRRLDRAAQVSAVDDALADGASTARQWRDRFAGLGPRGIARGLGVAVEAIDDDPFVGSLLRFAEYRPRPPGIMLYDRGLAALDSVLDDPLARRLLGSATLKDVFIAHELYHHAEAIRTEPPIARRHQATLFRLGNWHWRTGLSALSEIAAGACAQALLDLPCHPRVLDLVAVRAVRAQGPRL